MSKPDAEVIVESVFTPWVERRMERDAGETTDYFLSRVGSARPRVGASRGAAGKTKSRKGSRRKFLKPPEGDPLRGVRGCFSRSQKPDPGEELHEQLDLILENDEAFKGYLHFDTADSLDGVYRGRCMARTSQPWASSCRTGSRRARMLSTLRRRCAAERYCSRHAATHATSGRVPEGWCGTACRAFTRC